MVLTNEMFLTTKKLIIKIHTDKASANFKVYASCVYSSNALTVTPAYRFQKLPV